MMRMTQGLHRAAQVKPDGVATIFGNRKRSWSDVIGRVARLAAVLLSHGLNRGDRVAVIALNSDRYIELYYAVWWAGGVVVPGNTRWALSEHIYALRDSGAKLLLVDRAFADLVTPLQDACTFDAILYLDDGLAAAGTVDVDALLGEITPIPDMCGMDEDLAVIFYSGGTTGRSKGVMLTHRGLVSSYLCLAAVMPQRDDQVFLHSPPMFHVGDASMIVATTMIGGTHAIVPTFNPAAVAQTIAANGVTNLLLVPTMFSMLWDHANEHPVDLSSVRMVAYGAAPITESQLRQAMQLFPDAEFYHGYGLTELSPHVTLLGPAFHKMDGRSSSRLRSIGRAIAATDVRIVDAEMLERPRGAVGEIAVRGPGVMAGYWNQPEETRKTLIDGWVRTGDAGYMDEEGFVFLVDRIKDVIVSGGETIYSAEVENALSSHADIVECAVIGIPDEKWAEAVHAVIRLRVGRRVGADEIIAHCRTQIASYKCPRSIEFRTEPLPLSGAGKVLKTELRKSHQPTGGHPATL